MLYHEGGLFLFLPVFKLHRKAKASLFYSIILIDREHDNGRLSCVHSLLECSFCLDSTLEGKVQDSIFLTACTLNFLWGLVIRALHFHSIWLEPYPLAMPWFYILRHRQCQFLSWFSLFGHVMNLRMNHCPDDCLSQSVVKNKVQLLQEFKMIIKDFFKAWHSSHQLSLLSKITLGSILTWLIGRVAT